MIIHTTELKQYIICPMLYKHKDQPDLDPYLFSLKQALTYLYSFEMSNQKKVTKESMMAKWDSICTNKTKAVDGWMTIQKFMDRVYLKDERLPHIVNLDYKGQLGSIYIDTHFDVILSDKSGKLTLLEFSLETEERNLKLQLESDIESKTKLLILQKNLDHKYCELVRYNLNKRLTHAILKADKRFIHTTEKILMGLLNNIEQGLFYPAPQCKCPHPKECQNG